MTTLQVLTQARALIEKGWTRKVAARNAQGREVEATDPTAVRWCLEGALQATATAPNRTSWLAARAAVKRSLMDIGVSPPDLSLHNDKSPSKHRVLALLDRAIAAKRGQRG